MPVAASPDLDRMIDRKVTMARVVRTIEAAFKELPEDAADIALYFAGKGIVGGHGGLNCPVAVYLTDALTQAGLTGVYVQASSLRITVYDRPAKPVLPVGWQLSWIRPCPCGCDADSPYVVPAGVTGFIRDHDAYKYPFLCSQFASPLMRAVNGYKDPVAV